MRRGDKVRKLALLGATVLLPSSTFLTPFQSVAGESPIRPATGSRKPDGRTCETTTSDRPVDYKRTKSSNDLEDKRNGYCLVDPLCTTLSCYYRER